MILGAENYTNAGTLQAGILWYSAVGYHPTTAPFSCTTTLPDSHISLLLHSHLQSPHPRRTWQTAPTSTFLQPLSTLWSTLNVHLRLCI